MAYGFKMDLDRVFDADGLMEAFLEIQAQAVCFKELGVVVLRAQHLKIICPQQTEELDMVLEQIQKEIMTMQTQELRTEAKQMETTIRGKLILAAGSVFTKTPEKFVSTVVDFYQQDKAQVEAVFNKMIEQGEIQVQNNLVSLKAKAQTDFSLLHGYGTIDKPPVEPRPIPPETLQKFYQTKLLVIKANMTRADDDTKYTKLQLRQIQRNAEQMNFDEIFQEATKLLEKAENS